MICTALAIILFIVKMRSPTQPSQPSGVAQQPSQYVPVNLPPEPTIPTSQITPSSITPPSLISPPPTAPPKEPIKIKSPLPRTEDLTVAKEVVGMISATQNQTISVIDLDKLLCDRYGLAWYRKKTDRLLDRMVSAGMIKRFAEPSSTRGRPLIYVKLIKPSE